MARQVDQELENRRDNPSIAELLACVVNQKMRESWLWHRKAPLQSQLGEVVKGASDIGICGGEIRAVTVGPAGMVDFPSPISMPVQRRQLSMRLLSDQGQRTVI